MHLLYDLILLVAAAVLIPWYLLRGLRHGKVRRGIRERLGYYESDRLAPLAGRPVIWVHAVSVGETRAAIPLVRALKNAYPQSALVLSNVTETGHAIAGGIKEVDLCIFFPFDLSWVVRGALARINPSLIVIVETEIWPNFVRLAHQSGIPVLLVNGRISDRSYPRYRRARWLLRPILEQFSAFCMQTEQDAARIRGMGAPPGLVEVTRNLKFDMQATVPDPAAAAVLRQSLRLPDRASVWVAGSTHAGEEEVVLDVYHQLVGEGRDLILVLVPRHPERCRGIADMLNVRGIPFILRTAAESSAQMLAPGEVLLVDTVGEMLKLYAIADLVFVGGSLVAVGGHNVLEASLLKKPVIFGNYMHNFKEISQLLLAAGGGIQVAGRNDLPGAVKRLLDNVDEGRRMGERGHALLEANAGATEHTLAVIRRLLGN
ncbi:MAG TPA: 3-deoxy-D-manno-octulosonic acid transferase [Desulfuromonadales bacterium]